MALVLADRIRETTTTAGTGTITLAGAVTGYRSFATVGNGNTTYYTIAGQNTSEWEVGIGTYTAAGTTLSRDTVLASSNAGSLVTFSAGTKDVFVTYPAGKSLYQDANGSVAVTSGASGIPLTLTGGASSSNILSLNGSANVKLFDFNSTNANGAWGTFSNSGTVIGYIGASAPLLGGLASDFVFVAANAIKLGTSAMTRLTIASAGAITVAPPTSGNAFTLNTVGGATSPLVITGVASQTGANISTTTPSGTTNYWRLGQPGVVNWDIQNIGTTGEFRITNGTQVPFQSSGTGNVTINAPSSGVALSVSGVSTSNVINVTTAAGATPIQVSDGTATSWWFTNGTNGIGFGTQTAHALSLYTNNTAKVQIASAGNVTINAPTSGTALTVSTTGANTSSALTLSTNGDITTAGPAVYQRFNYGAGSAGGYIGFGGTANQMEIFNYLNGGIVFATNATSRMSIGGSGNIAIAAPTSGNSLSVAGVASGTALTVTNSTSGAGSEYLQSWSNGTDSNLFVRLNQVGASSKFALIETSTATPITFSTNSSTRVTIGAAGGVTIAAPVSGTALAITGNAGTDIVSVTDGVVSLNLYCGGSQTYFGNRENANLNFMTNGTVKQVISGAGNVTINAPTSGEALRVSGVTISGNAASTAGSKILGGYYASGDSIATFGGEYSNGGPVIGYGVWPSTTAAASFVSSTGITVSRGAYTILGADHIWYGGASQTAAVDAAVTLSEKMRLNANGNFTINAPTSGVPLTISGLGSVNTNIINFNGNTTGSQYIQWNSSGNTTNLGIDNSSGGYLVTGSPAYATVLANNLARDLVLGTNNAVRVLIGSAGNVTINAPSSGTALSVSAATGAISIPIAAFSQATNGTNFTVNSPSASGSYLFSALAGDSVLRAEANNLAIGSVSGSTSIATATRTIATFSSTGNVTINAPTSGVGLTVRAASGTHSTQIADSANTLYDAGYLGVPQNSQTAAYVLALVDRGKHISITTGGVTVNASIFSAGDTISIYNNSASSQTITQGTSVTMYLGGTATTGNRTLAQRGVCTVLCVASNTFVISGAGLT